MIRTRECRVVLAILHYTFMYVRIFSTASPRTSWHSDEFVLPRRFIISQSNNGLWTPSKPDVYFLFLTDSRFVEMLPLPRFYPSHLYSRLLQSRLPLGDIYRYHTPNVVIVVFIYYYVFSINIEIVN